jgi:hypothetical protein
MMSLPTEDGLRIVDEQDETDREEVDTVVPSDPSDGPGADPDLESLRDEFVEAFNARDPEAVLALVHPDVECLDIGEGAELLAEELEAIWERSPGAILTRAFLDATPCAVGWLPDEDGCWSRAGLVCFDGEDSLLSRVALPDDADALERAEAEEPTGEEVPEWSDWGEWDRGEETVVKARQ